MEKIHFIGIGGIGMSALALIALDRGAIVTGSDLSENAQVELLRKKGAHIFMGHQASNVPDEAVVVCSTDIKPDNPEKQESIRKGLKILHRSAYLAKEMAGKKPLLITGTHGKTTTSTLLAHTLVTAKLDPTFVLGGVSLNYGTNVQIGSGEYFVAEADESDGTHLCYPSHGGIVTNIDNDHLAHYGSIEAIEKALLEFLYKIEDPSRRVFCMDDDRLRSSKMHGKGYGFHPDSDLRVMSYTPCAGGSQVVYFEKATQKTYKLFLPLFGKHNALNGAAVFLLSRNIGISPDVIQKAFFSFLNVKRRLESKCKTSDFDLFDDYAHHPTEVKATLQAVRDAYPNRRLVALFQPHRPSRIRHVFSCFEGAFSPADVIILTDLYLSSEKIDAAYSHESFVSFVRSTHPSIPVEYMPRKSLQEDLLSFVQPNDVLVCMGAGDSTKVAAELGVAIRARIKV